MASPLEQFIVKPLIPIKVGDISVNSEGVVDHSTKKETDNSVIQKNANFELSIRDVSGEPYTGHTYNEYLDKYYLNINVNLLSMCFPVLFSREE